MIRLEMNRKQEAILASIIIVAALAAFVLYSGILQSLRSDNEPNVSVEDEPAPQSLAEIIAEQIEDYNEIYESHLEMLEEGQYTADSPLILINPYGTAPISALIAFETEEPMMTTVLIPGTTEDTSIEYSDETYKTSHMVPIYGLYCDTTNLVSVVATPLPQSSQEAQTNVFMLETEGIPDWFPKNLIWKYVEQERDYSANPEFFFTHMRLSAFDINGDYRWVYSGYETQYPTRYADNGNILMVIGSFEDEDALLLEIDMLGRLLSAEPMEDEDEWDGYGTSYVEMRPIYEG